MRAGWPCPSFGENSLSFPSRPSTYPANLCCDLIQLTGLMAKRRVRVDSEMYYFYCPAGNIFCNLDKKEWNAFLNRTQWAISLYFYKPRALWGIWGFKIFFLMDQLRCLPLISSQHQHPSKSGPCSLVITDFLIWRIQLPLTLWNSFH